MSTRRRPWRTTRPPTGENLRERRDGEPPSRGGGLRDGTPRRGTDCETWLTYAFLLVFFVVGVLVAAADRPTLGTRHGTPNTPWSPPDSRGGGAGAGGGWRGSTRGAGGGRGSGGDSRADAGSSPHLDDDDDEASQDEDEGDDRHARRHTEVDVGLWEGLGIILVDRLVKVRDYLEGVVDTMETWEKQLRRVSEELDGYLTDVSGKRSLLKDANVDAVGGGGGLGGGVNGERRAVRADRGRG